MRRPSVYTCHTLPTLPWRQPSFTRYRCHAVTENCQSTRARRNELFLRLVLALSANGRLIAPSKACDGVCARSGVSSSTVAGALAIHCHHHHITARSGMAVGRVSVYDTRLSGAYLAERYRHKTRRASFLIRASPAFPSQRRVTVLSRSWLASYSQSEARHGMYLGASRDCPSNGCWQSPDERPSKLSFLALLLAPRWCFFEP
ncbi:hypothetical protein IWX90DRAFT_129529 [Phyllosticta citrichinensis]|uniref:Uncharacterized protein n=1 Tax=Phyllosticta citrichinensis TaxID=1130410 RepID=A0ABR1Y4D2_9PEZI